MKARNFTTPSRSSNPSRIKKKITITSTALQDIKGNFDACVSDIRDKFKYVNILTKPEEIPLREDILRYQLVSIESLLDYFVHQILTYGFKKIFNEEWRKTDPYKNINIPLVKVEYAVQHPESTVWIEKIIEEYDAKRCLMSGEGLAKVLESIGINPEQIATHLGFATFDSLKAKIQSIYLRRCNIVHHADMDSRTKAKCSITRDETAENIDLIVELCNEIYATALGMG